MFGVEAALITAKCMMKVIENNLRLLRLLLKVTRRNKLHKRKEKIDGKGRFFFSDVGSDE